LIVTEKNLCSKTSAKTKTEKQQLKQHCWIVHNCR